MQDLQFEILKNKILISKQQGSQSDVQRMTYNLNFLLQSGETKEYDHQVLTDAMYECWGGSAGRKSGMCCSRLSPCSPKREANEDFGGGRCTGKGISALAYRSSLRPMNLCAHSSARELCVRARARHSRDTATLQTLAVRGLHAGCPAGGTAAPRTGAGGHTCRSASDVPHCTSACRTSSALSCVRFDISVSECDW